MTCFGLDNLAHQCSLARAFAACTQDVDEIHLKNGLLVSENNFTQDKMIYL